MVNWHKVVRLAVPLLSLQSSVLVYRRRARGEVHMKSIIVHTLTILNRVQGSSVLQERELIELKFRIIDDPLE